MDRLVIEAMTPFLSEEPANPHASDHALGWRAHAAVDKAADQIAQTIGSDQDEIIFTSGATEANNLAILGIIRRAPSDRCRILVSAIEHKSVLSSARATARYGFAVEQIPVDRAGIVDLAALERLLADDVLLVSVMAVNNEIGSLQPLREVAERVHRVGAYIHSDAAQALSATRFDVEELGLDLASFSGHKIYGPKGIGSLYVRRAVQSHIEPLMYGGDQQNGLRPGTLPVPLCVGFGIAAMLMVTETAEEERLRIRHLRDRLVDRLIAIQPGIVLNGPSATLRHPGNANVRFAGFCGSDLLASVQPTLAASTGSACTSGIPEPSHVLRAIGLSVEESESSIRFGVGRFTTPDHIDQAVALIERALCSLLSAPERLTNE
jgi:cysteine desulfurase